MSSAHLSHPKYREDIDGLRAVAVIPVVVFHAFPGWVSGGFIGVDVFFVISGYLISTILLENLDRGTFSIREFYARRIKRIFPALFVVLAACHAFGWFALLEEEYEHLGKHVAAGAGFASNFVLWREAGYFDKSELAKPLLHLWSLGIEEQFYVVWPVVLWLAWRWRLNFLAITLLIMAVSLYLNLTGIEKDPTATFYSPQTRIWELLCGSLLAWVTLNKARVCAALGQTLGPWLPSLQDSKNREAVKRALRNASSIAGLTMLVFGFFQFSKELGFPGAWAILPVAGTVLLLVSGPQALVNRTLLSNRVAIWFGTISYPLYLWHWPLLAFARIIETEAPGSEIRVACVALSISLAWLTYMLLERPIRFGNPTAATTPFLVLLMFTVGYFGYKTYRVDGTAPSGPMVRAVDGTLKRGDLLSGTPCEGFRAAEGDADCRAYGSGGNLVVVWGDSHALALRKAIPKRFVSGDIRLMIIAHTGCPPIEGVVRTDKIGNAANCSSKDTLANYASYVKSLNPSKVVLTGRWTLYLRGWKREGQLQGATHYLATGSGEVTSELSSRRAFVEGMRRTISGFGSADVFVLGQVPDLHHLDRRAIETTDSIKRLGVDRWHSVEVDAFKELSGSPFQYIDLREHFCDKVNCPLKVHFEPLYADDNHLSGLGVLRIWDLLRASLWRGSGTPP